VCVCPASASSTRKPPPAYRSTKAQRRGGRPRDSAERRPSGDRGGRGARTLASRLRAARKNGCGACMRPGAHSPADGGLILGPPPPPATSGPVQRRRCWTRRHELPQHDRKGTSGEFVHGHFRGRERGGCRERGPSKRAWAMCFQVCECCPPRLLRAVPRTCVPLPQSRGLHHPAWVCAQAGTRTTTTTGRARRGQRRTLWPFGWLSCTGRTPLNAAQEVMETLADCARARCLHFASTCPPTPPPNPGAPPRALC